MLQQAQVYVDQLRREASKRRITVSEAIADMKVGVNFVIIDIDNTITEELIINYLIFYIIITIETIFRNLFPRLRQRTFS